MRRAAVTTRRPGVRMVPVSSSNAFAQVGRVNRSENSASRDSKRAGSGDQSGVGEGWLCFIRSVESASSLGAILQGCDKANRHTVDPRLTARRLPYYRNGRPRPGVVAWIDLSLILLS